MKITDVETIVLRQPEVKLIGDGTQDVLIVKVHTDEGIVGIGETHTSPYVAKMVIDAPVSHVAARGLKEIITGQDPTRIASLWEQMYRFTSVFGRRGVAINAISAVDMALYDILGKIVNQPVYKLLGGAFRDKIKVYASTLMSSDANRAVEDCLNLVDQGFKAIKLGWGNLGQDPKHDYQRIKAIREAVGSDVDLMVDIGVGMNRHDALLLADLLSDLEIFFLEEPLPPDDIEGFAWLSQKSKVRIATGEKETTFWGFNELINRGNLHVIQPDVGRAGGLTECKIIADYAHKTNTMCIPHCWSTDILVSATLHLIASMPKIPYFEYCVWPTPIRQFVAQEPIKAVKGFVEIPQKPGLGIELNEDTIQKYRYQ